MIVIPLRRHAQVHPGDPVSPIDSLESRAERIANICADGTSPRWACAFHHAIDLLAYARGYRVTTRCLSNYEPNETEQKVEAILAKKNIRRGMRPGT